MKRAIATVAIALGIAVLPAIASAQDIKIGAVFDQTGPFAGGGSKAAALGTKILIDIINEKGGVEGHKIVPIFADAQSKIDVAINEAERLLNEQKVDILTGFYSSAQCVPVAAKVDAAKKFLWMPVCVVLRGAEGQEPAICVPPDDPLRSVRRCVVLVHRRKCQGQARQGRRRTSRSRSSTRTGLTASASRSANETRCKELGMQVVHKEAYSATTSDLSAMVTKLRRAQPDVILHTGYNPDITLFLRQAKDAGLKFSALIGHGAGYSQIDKLYETFKDDVNYLLDVDPAPAQVLDPKTLAPGLGDLIAEMVKRYKAEAGATEVPPHTSMGFNNHWILLTDVLPRAIKKYGGWDPEALRKAALETDIPIGGTMQGYGVKFFRTGHADGRTERAVDRGGDAVRGRQDQRRVAAADQERGAGVSVPEGPRLREVTARPNRL